jgi:hypothetical protein
MTAKRDLRDLARKIEAVTKSHFCYGQAIKIVSNCCDHLCAIARIEELNRVVENKPPISKKGL